MLYKDNWAGITTYTHLGLTFALSVVLFFFAGYWLDGKIGTRPLLAIVGAFLGATGGFINLVRTLNRIQKEQDNQQNDTRK